MTTPRGKFVGSSVQDGAGAFDINRRYGIDSGSTDDYAITLDPAPSGYYEGMEIYFKANTANTTACTINVNALGAKSLVLPVSTTAVTTNYIKAGSIVHCIYDGTNFQILQVAAA